MPEGHTIHRLARDHRRLFAGRALAASSPQGRAAGAAEAIDGRVLEGADAYGKHLFHRYEGDLTLHVHLGLYGRFRTFRRPAPPPRPLTRLRLETDEVVAHLSGATACELLDPEAEARLLARLGPDPLRPDADLELAWAALRRRRVPVGAALMDQRVIAGVGNVYRAEALLMCSVDPWRPARELDREAFDCLWATLVEQLAAGVRRGRIVTVPGATRRRRREAVHVYKRATCARCGGPVRSAELAARTLWWCPACQR